MKNYRLSGILAATALFAFACAFAGETLTPDAIALLRGNGADPAVYAATDADARLANSVTAELYADMLGTTVAGQHLFRDSLPSIADYCQSAHLVSSSYCEPDAKWVMWDTPFLARDMRKRNDDALGYKQTVSGFATGVSRMLGETTAVGLAVGYDARKLTGRDDYHWRNKTDTFHAAIYGGTALGCFFIDGYAGYSRAWQRSERFVDAAAGAGRNTDGFLNKGNYNDTVFSAGIKASYVWILPNDVRIIPAIGLDYSHARQDGFSERGRAKGALAGVAADNFTALRTSSSSHDSLQTPITVAVNKTFSSDFLTFGEKCSLWTPEVRAGYIPQFGAKRAGVDYAFASANNIMTAGGGQNPLVGANSTKLGGSYGTVGAGLKIKLKDKFIFAVDYDYCFGSKYDKHVVTGTYGVSF